MMSTQEIENKILNYFIKLKSQYDDTKALNLSVLVKVKSTTKTGIIFSSNALLSITHSLTIQAEIEKYTKKILENNRTQQYFIETKYSYSSNTLDTEEKVADNNNIQTFKVEPPKYKIEDVYIPEKTKKELDIAISMVKNFDIVYNKWGFIEKEPSAKTILLFYGVPGTGKTMAAHGIASILEKNILIASYADIQSKYVGDGPKNLKSIFEQAEKNNAVLFFDEADSFLRKRTLDSQDSASMHYNSMTNEMMKHLEDFNGIVIFATNLTENTDEAFKTRISASVEFLVPDLEIRSKIIKFHIPDNLPVQNLFTEDDYKNIGQICEGFVGRDIRNAVKMTLFSGAENIDTNFTFTVDNFITGFKNYKEGKDKFNKEENLNSTNIYDLIEWNTSTSSSILQLCMHAAWFDGVENDKETAELKNISKLLNRDKPTISKISDLWTVNELCEKITNNEHKLIALQYVIKILAISDNDDNNLSFISNLLQLLNISQENQTIIYEYYHKHRELNNIWNKLNNK